MLRPPSFPALAVAVIVLLLSPSVAGAQVRHDGHTWLALTRELRVSYIQGLIDGSVLGVMLSKETLPDSDTCQDKMLSGYRKAAQTLLADVSPAQIVDGVDTVFKDYRNRSLLMTDAVYVTLKAIAGMPPEDVEKLLQAVRRAPK